MVWYYPYRKFEHEELVRTIRTSEGLRAGWMLSAYEPSDWLWCRIVHLRTEDTHHIHRIELVRPCTTEEKEKLNQLLWSAQICLRYHGVEKRKPPWAIACID